MPEKIINGYILNLEPRDTMAAIIDPTRGDFERVNVLCLDLEGVLIPEIWQAVAARTRIKALEKTTRDVPDYIELMDLRLKSLGEHDVTWSLIRDVIATLDPLPGAAEFLRWARRRYQVAIVSDTFYQFVDALMEELDRPLLLCHDLDIAEDRITGYRIRQPDPKRQVVRAFRSLNYTVTAAGDSFNDVSMLEEAHRGIFFRAPDNVVRTYPQYPLVDGYEALQALLEAPGE